MTGLPGLNITLLNNQLGAAGAGNDGIMALCLSCDVAPSGLALSTPKVLFALKDAEDIGINAAYDTDNSVDVYHQIKDFYNYAGDGTELWIMVIPQTTTMASACDKTGDIVKKLLGQAAGAAGRVRMWGITRVPDAAFTPTYSDGIDDDVDAAVLAAHALNQEQQAGFNPCRALVGARAFQGNAGNLKDFRQNSNNTVGVVLGATTDDGYPAVGACLGQFANRPVQRKISRVQDGDLGLTDAYLTDGQKVETYQSAWDSIHDKGYIFFRKFPNKSGYYWNSDSACVVLTDDYAVLSRGRVIDKALRIVYSTMVEELEDDIVLVDGFPDPAVLKSYQSKVLNQLNLQMQGEISGARCVIPPAQNILATNEIKFEKVGVIPKGYTSYLDINLGFENPANN